MARRILKPSIPPPGPKPVPVFGRFETVPVGAMVGSVGLVSVGTTSVSVGFGVTVDPPTVSSLVGVAVAVSVSTSVAVSLGVGDGVVS